jgi:hypothetical protein
VRGNVALLVPPESAAAAARADYLAGCGQAQANLNSPPPADSAGAAGHADYVQAAAQIDDAYTTTGAVPAVAAGTAAAVAALDYQQGLAATSAPAPGTAADLAYSAAGPKTKKAHT